MIRRIQAVPLSSLMSHGADTWDGPKSKYAQPIKGKMSFACKYKKHCDCPMLSCSCGCHRIKNLSE